MERFLPGQRYHNCNIGTKATIVFVKLEKREITVKIWQSMEKGNLTIYILR